MEQCTDLQWREWWAEVLGRWPRFDPTPQEARAWKASLQRFPHVALIYAANTVYETRATEYPKVAHFIPHARAKMQELSAGTRPDTGRGESVEVIDAPSRDQMVADLMEADRGWVLSRQLSVAVQHPHLWATGEDWRTPDVEAWPRWLLAKVWARWLAREGREVPTRLVPPKSPGRHRPLREWVRDDPDGWLARAARGEVKPTGSGSIGGAMLEAAGMQGRGCRRA